MMHQLQQMLIHTKHLREAAEVANLPTVIKRLDAIDETIYQAMKEAECEMLERLAEEAE